MKTKTKIAIIGCGMIADAHVNEIRKIKDTAVVAVCDKEQLMAAQLAERYGIPHHFESFEQLVEKCHPDVVHILTPPATHLSLGIAAMNMGCHVLMEKPFTVTAEEALQLIETAQALDRKVVVNHFHNFSPPAIRLRQMVSRGVLGDILHLEGFYSYSTNSPVASALFNDKKSWLHRLPGKLLHNNIDHLIGKFVEFLPDTKIEVKAHARRVSEGVRRIEHSHIHDELRALICGASVSAYATFSSNIEPFQQSMTVYGTKRSVCIDYESRAFVTLPSSSLPGPFGKLFIPFMAGKGYLTEGIKNLINFGKSEYHFYAGANNLFKQFYRCIREGTNVPIPYANIIKTTLIMDKIFKQINDSL